MATGYTRADILTQTAGISETAPEERAEVDVSIFAEDVFRALLTREKRRAERSGNPFILILVDGRSNRKAAQRVILNILPVLKSSIRETDTLGWYSDASVLGAIFTEIGEKDPANSASTLRGKVKKALVEKLGANVLTR